MNILLNNRLTRQPTFAIEVVNFFEQNAAMSHRHEEDGEEIRRRHEAVQADRIEQVKSETRSELGIAMHQHEDNCRLERERLNDSFIASLAADGPSNPTRNPERAVDPQQPRGTIDGTRTDGSVLQDQPHTPHQASDFSFSDSDFASIENRCYVCGQMSNVDSNGCCLACLIQQSGE